MNDATSATLAFGAIAAGLAGYAVRLLLRRRRLEDRLRDHPTPSSAFREDRP